MPFSSDPFARRENLWLYATAMTLAGLCALYVLAQAFSYRIPTVAASEKIEIRELEKLVMPKADAIMPPQTQPFKLSRTPTTQSRPRPLSPAHQSPAAKVASPALDVAALLEGFDTKMLLAATGDGSRSRQEHGGHFSQVRVETSRATLRAKTDSDFASASVPRGRSRGRGEGHAHGVGASLETGAGSGLSRSSGAPGLSSSPVTNLFRRSGKGKNSESDSETSIGIRGSTNASREQQGVSIHDLITWMKSHPGAIPKLVQYDMEHRAGDLAAAVTFTLNGARYEMFLSCNVANSFLRICLIEGKNFTMLKDNGIKETSNFLAMGEVVRSGAAIQSLITSRQAPGETAQKFYDIFWSWWEREKK